MKWVKNNLSHLGGILCALVLIFVLDAPDDYAKFWEAVVYDILMGMLGYIMGSLFINTWLMNRDMD